MRAPIALLLLCACGSTATVTRLFDEEDIDGLRAESPTEVAAAEEAEREALDARAAGDESAAREWETAARMRFEFAQLKAELGLVRAKASELRAALTEAQRFVDARDGEREQIIAAQRDARVRDAALEEAARAFAVAESDEQRRLRRRSPEVNEARLRAALALSRRTELLTAAAAALGTPAPEGHGEAIRALRNEREPGRAIAEGRRLHAEALARLGQARGEASAEACRTFVAMARERRFDADLRDEGVVIRAPERARVLAELLSSIPGPIVLQGELGAVGRVLERALEGRVRVLAGEERAPLVLIPSCGD